MATLTAEQQTQMKELVSKLGSITLVIQKEIQSKESQQEESQKQTTALKAAIKSVKKNNDIFEDINTALYTILETQQLILSNVKGVKPKVTTPEGLKVKEKPEPVEEAGEGFDFSPIKSIIIGPLLAAGAVYMIDTLLSPEMRAKVRAFVGGMLGVDFTDINEKMEDFKQGVEIATMAITAYLAMRGVQGIAGLIRGRTGGPRLGGRWGALAAAIGAGVAYWVYDEATGETDEERALREEYERIFNGEAPRPQQGVSGTGGEAPAAAGTATQDILNRIALGEGSYLTPERMGEGYTEYDTVYGYGQFVMPDKPVSEMTFTELYEYQRQLIAATRGRVPGTSYGTSAVGKYQMVATSLYGAGRGPNNAAENSWFAKAGLSPSDTYSPENQERLARVILDEIRLDERIAQGDFAGAQDAIARQWASQRTSSGADLYGQGAREGLDTMGDLYRQRQSEMSAPAPAAPAPAPVEEVGSAAGVVSPVSARLTDLAGMREDIDMPSVQIIRTAAAPSATGIATTVMQNKYDVKPSATAIERFQTAFA